MPRFRKAGRWDLGQISQSVTCDTLDCFMFQMNELCVLTTISTLHSDGTVGAFILGFTTGWVS